MAQRVSADDVRAICDLDADLNVEPFILVASALVDAHLASVGLSATMLTEIERWLAAHFACVYDPRLTEMGTGPDRVRYEGGATGEGLKSTRYGQQAVALDSSGTLRRLAQGTQLASFEVL